VSAAQPSAAGVVDPDPRSVPVTCRWCGRPDGQVVLDLGDQPAADHFPAVEDPDPDPVYPLRMWLCGSCGLAQLAEDPTTPDEPRGTEPEALVAQARDAVARAQAAGLLPDGGTVTEFGSPHGGSWLDLLAAVGLTEAAPGAPADVVVDCFGLMHAADQAAGLAERAAATAPGGTLLLQFHTLAAIVADGSWNALRHGHFAYFATPVLARMLEGVGFEVTHGFVFDLYGGTVLLAARRRDVDGPRDPESLARLLEREAALGVTDPAGVGALEQEARRSAEALREHLVAARDAGRTVVAYAAASRAVPLLNRAGVGPDLLPAVADASPGKRGRRMPGVGVPIVAPEELAVRRLDDVVLFVADMLAEMRRRLPEVEASGGRWVVADPTLAVPAPTTRDP
jgi:hypothetical protein